MLLNIISLLGIACLCVMHGVARAHSGVFGGGMRLKVTKSFYIYLFFKTIPDVTLYGNQFCKIYNITVALLRSVARLSSSY